MLGNSIPVAEFVKPTKGTREGPHPSSAPPLPLQVRYLFPNWSRGYALVLMIPHTSTRLRESDLLDDCAPEILPLRCAQGCGSCTQDDSLLHCVILSARS